MPNLPPELLPAGRFPEYDVVRRGDMAGHSVFDLPDGLALQALRRCLKTTLPLGRG